MWVRADIQMVGMTACVQLQCGGMRWVTVDGGPARGGMVGRAERGLPCSVGTPGQSDGGRRAEHTRRTALPATQQVLPPATRDGGRDAWAGGDQVRDRGRPGVPRPQLGHQLNYTSATPKQLSMGECDLSLTIDDWGEKLLI